MGEPNNTPPADPASPPKRRKTDSAGTSQNDRIESGVGKILDKLDGKDKGGTPPAEPAPPPPDNKSRAAGDDSLDDDDDETSELDQWWNS